MKLCWGCQKARGWMPGSAPFMDLRVLHSDPSQELPAADSGQVVAHSAVEADVQRVCDECVAD